MVRDLYNETKAKVLWPFENCSEGFRKVILEGKIDGKRERGKPRRQWETYRIFSICLSCNRSWIDWQLTQKLFPLCGQGCNVLWG